MPQLRLHIEGDISEILMILNRIGDRDMDINKRDDCDMPSPLEVLESVRQTFEEYAKHDNIPPVVKGHLKFGADFIQKMIDSKGLEEDDFALELLIFAQQYTEDELPY